MSEIQQQHQYYNMVNTSKMGDLDVNLITLYARTPALYDKKNPFYKDKQYSERAWNDIAMKLGYKVEILKDRMLQLRNRYNLEKRKIESMRSESCPNPKSTWALYKYLLFFDGHIKQRRSYKMLRKIQEAEEAEKKMNETSNESFAIDLPEMPKLTRHRNDSVSEIKNEQDEDSNMVEAIPILSENSVELDLNQKSINNEQCTSSTYKRPASSLDDVAAPASQMQMLHHNPFTAATTSSSYEYANSLDKKYNKYNAFGQFISAALADMTDDKATDVMQRITMEIFAAQRDIN